MTKDTIETDLKIMTKKLIEIARNSCWNAVSDNCLYILSEIDYSVTDNFFELRKARKRNNAKKDPKSLNKIVADLDNIYSNLYDITLNVYKAKRNLTIIEIQYYPKSSLDHDYLEKVKDNDPCIHSKVSIPPYLNSNEMFDINWELGGLRYQWKRFWLRQRNR